jgi:hypothetical protein
MLDTIKAIAEIFALVAAGAYFFYRLVSGYFVVNLTVALTVTRQPIPYVPEDYLSITASLAKGDRGSLELHDAQVLITSPYGEQIHSSWALIGEVCA